MKINLSDATTFSGGFLGANIVKSEQNLKKKKSKKQQKKLTKNFVKNLIMYFKQKNKFS